MIAAAYVMIAISLAELIRRAWRSAKRADERIDNEQGWRE